VSACTSTHSALVAKLAAAGALTKGFSSAVLDAVAGKHGSHDLKYDGAFPYRDCLRCVVKEGMGTGKIVPDAYVVDAERMEVIAYEVEVTSPVTEFKLEKYINWWWALDEEYWSLRLIIVDRFGNHKEVDLFRMSVDPHADEGHLNELRARAGIRKLGEVA
jgi:hypothetical protein